MEHHAALASSGYRSIIKLPVQWGDQDAFGHVNNTVPIRWFESSRIAYLEHSGIGLMLEQLELGPILASIQCDYRRQLRYPDTVWVGAKVVRLGRASMAMVHAVHSDAWGDTVAAEGESVIVVFDYQANRPRPIPDPLREAITAFDGPHLNQPSH